MPHPGRQELLKLRKMAEKKPMSVGGKREGQEPLLCSHRLPWNGPRCESPLQEGLTEQPEKPVGFLLRGRKHGEACSLDFWAPRGTESRVSERKLHIPVYSGLVPISQEAEGPQCP